MNIQWFPGHMTKTRRLITENLKLVDVVIELVDARLPMSSRNPEINAIVNQKPRIVVLNKCDMADEEANRAWLDYFKQGGIPAMLLDSLTGRGMKNLTGLIDRVLKEKFEREAKKGMVRHSVRMMVVGIPNVGKSSFINRLSGRAAARTGDRPGVTMAKQWIRISGKYELLDTPGILWPKFEDEETAKRIAYTGGIKDEIMDIEGLCFSLLALLREHYAKNLTERYKLDMDISDMQGHEILHAIGRKRGCVVSGGEIDTFRAASIVMDEFRAAKLGRITLERPGDFEESGEI